MEKMKDPIEAYVLAQRAFHRIDQELAKYKEVNEILMTFIKSHLEVKVHDWEIKMLLEQVEQKLL